MTTTIYKKNNKFIYCRFKSVSSYRYSFVFYFDINYSKKNVELRQHSLNRLKFERCSFLHLDFNTNIQEYFSDLDNYNKFFKEVKSFGDKNIYYSFDTVSKKLKLMEVLS